MLNEHMKNKARQPTQAKRWTAELTDDEQPSMGNNHLENIQGIHRAISSLIMIGVIISNITRRPCDWEKPSFMLGKSGLVFLKLINIIIHVNSNFQRKYPAK